ncbi:MAG: hypothetical protein HRU19_16830 [Pseudobacteriovorax sp.]|nr:hypothetical protein [Pseudobacteriovorax sp.]
MDFVEDFTIPEWDQWQSSVIKVLTERGFHKLTKTLEEGVTVSPLYQTGIGVSDSRPLGTNGTWQITQTYSCPDLSLLKKTIDQDLMGGVQYLSFIVGQDHAVPLNTPEAMNRLFSGVYLEAVTLSFSLQDGFEDFATMLESYLLEKGYCLKDLDIRLSWTPFSQTASTESLKVLAGLIQEKPDISKWLTLSGASVYDAGGTGAKELGFLLASLLETLKHMCDLGLKPETCLDKSMIQINLGTDQFYEIAKIRAAHMLLKKLFSELELDDSQFDLPILAKSSLRHYSRTDHWVNILRMTIMGAAAGLSGVDAIEVAPYDCLFGQPSDSGYRIARNIHHILLEESHLHRVQDPAGGSPYIEKLTLDIAAKAWHYFQEIQKVGGATQALTSNWISDDLASERQTLLKNLRTRRRPLTGTSEFPNPSAKWPREGMNQDGPGTLTHSTLLPLFRESAIFEDLWLRGNEVSDASLFMLVLGSLSDHSPRSIFSSNILGIAGMEAVLGKGGLNEESLIADYRESSSAIVIIAGKDEHYDLLAASLASKLKSLGAWVILAQNPKDRRAEYESSGIDDFVFLGCDVVTVLENLLKRIEESRELR